MKSMIKTTLALLLLSTSAYADVKNIKVSAITETTAIKGDADDPAIWVHPSNPAASLVLGTDKAAGLHVFNMQGQSIQFFADGKLNNVDLREFNLNGEQVWLAAATERTDENIVFYIIHADGRVEHATPFAFPAAPKDSLAEDVYGFTMQRDPKTGRVYALANYKSGDIYQWEVTEKAGKLSLSLVRHFAVKTQPEGMVSDDRMGHIYVGEEDVAIWRFPAAPEAAAIATQIASIPSECFPEDDIEGLSLYDGNDGRYLIASAQGIHRAAVFSLNGDDIPACTALVEIGAGIVDGVSETDGLDITSQPLGDDYPAGMLVMMDDQNSGFSTNFKYISWADIATQLPSK